MESVSDVETGVGGKGSVMGGSKRIWVAVLVAAVMIGVIALLRWRLEGLLREVGTVALSAMLIGVVVGLLTRAREVRDHAAGLVRAVPGLLGREGRDYLVPGELPPPPAIFVGRQGEVERVCDMLRSAGATRHRIPSIILVHGDAGVGKSGFAIRVATNVVSDFADGVVYMSLTRVGQAAAEDRNERVSEVLADLVDSLQGPGDVVPAGLGQRLATYHRLSRRRRRLGRARRALYLFDDVPGEAVLRELLPAGRRSVVLATSRSELGGLGDCAKRVPLRPLRPPEDAKLLAALVGEQSVDIGTPGATTAGELPRGGDERTDESANATFARIVASAHGYPFALHLAARAISNQGLMALQDVVRELPESRDADDAGERMLDLSVGALTPVQRRTLISLAWLDEPVFVPWMVAAVADGLSEDEAWVICERLADQRLLERMSVDATGVVQLRMPDRVAAYVSSRAKARAQADEVRARSRLTAATARRRGRDLGGVLACALEDLHRGRLARAVDEARGALEEARTRSAQAGWAVGELSIDERQALGVLAETLAEMGGLSDALEIATAENTARAAAALEPHLAPPDGASVRLWRVLGRLRRRQLRLAESIQILHAALRVAQQEHDVDEQVLCLREIAIAEATRPDGADEPITRAREWLREAAAVVAASGQRDYLECRLAEARALVHLNHVRYHDGQAKLLDEALDELDTATKHLPYGYLLWEAWFDYHRARVRAAQAELAAPAANTPGDGELRAVERHRDLLFEARNDAQSALDKFAASSHKFGVARSRLEVGLTYAGEGRRGLALPLLEEARETLFFCGDRWVEALAALALGELRLRDDAAGPPTTEVARLATDELGFAFATFQAVQDERHAARAAELLQRLQPSQPWRPRRLSDPRR